MTSNIMVSAGPSDYHRERTGDRSARARLAIVVLFFLLAATMVFALTWGASDIEAFDVIVSWFGVYPEHGVAERDRLILETIRLPRILMGALIGAALAVSGALMQGLFRNPLADPGIVGVTAGSALGAVSIIVLGGTFAAPLMAAAGIFALPLAAFCGGLVTTVVLYRIATRQGQTSVATMLMAGIALGALAFAITGILIFMADDSQLRDLTFWGLGSIAGATWAKLWVTAPPIALVLVATPFLARALNALAFGEAAAHQMGIPVQRMKRIAIVTVAAATGSAVAVSGGIGFVGIIVPHLLRLSIGPDHTYLLPSSALLGAILLLLADCVSRTVVAPAELPIGIITACIGAPFFLFILLRKRGILDL